MLEIPVELQAILIGFLTMILTQGMKALANLLGKDFSGWASAFVAVVVRHLSWALKVWLAWSRQNITTLPLVFLR